MCVCVRSTAQYMYMYMWAAGRVCMFVCLLLHDSGFHVAELLPDSVINYNICCVGLHITRQCSRKSPFPPTSGASSSPTSGLFYNGTGGTLTCFDIDTEFIQCADPTGCGLGPALLAWDFQVCVVGA